MSEYFLSTAKKTKTLKNGDVMAFISLEDRLAEIEVIVFAKQYARFSDEITEENAVIIEGRINEEDGELPKIIASKISALQNNLSFKSIHSEDKITGVIAKEKTQRIYVKMEKFDESRLAPIYRLANLNPGTAEIAVFDASVRKYIAIKNIKLSSGEKVIERLRSIYGESNVAVK